jgi:hypothetical protein
LTTIYIYIIILNSNNNTNKNNDNNKTATTTTTTTISYTYTTDTNVCMGLEVCGVIRPKHGHHLPDDADGMKQQPINHSLAIYV